MSAMPNEWEGPPPQRRPAKRRQPARPARREERMPPDRPESAEPTPVQEAAPATRVTAPETEPDNFDERPAPRAPFIMLVLALVAGGMVALVLLNTAINENAFRLDALRDRQEKLDLREQQLHRDLAELESSGSLAAAAKRLGLVFAGNPAFIELPSGRVVGVPTPAGS